MATELTPEQWLVEARSSIPDDHTLNILAACASLDYNEYEVERQYEGRPFADMWSNHRAEAFWSNGILIYGYASLDELTNGRFSVVNNAITNRATNQRIRREQGNRNQDLVFKAN